MSQTRTCEHCGGSFTVPYPSDRKTNCSRECGLQTAWKKRGVADDGPCIIDGCERSARVKARQLCDPHYQRLRRYGDPLAGRWFDFTRATPAKQRLLARLVPQADGCWYWTGVVDADGYGRVGYKGRTSETIQRAVYDCFVGPIPDGMAVDHTCHTRSQDCRDSAACMHRRCGNPEHLEPVTTAENTVRNNNTRKTACKHGHDYTPENTIKRNGKRFCRACREQRSRGRRTAVAS